MKDQNRHGSASVSSAGMATVQPRSVFPSLSNRGSAYAKCMIPSRTWLRAALLGAGLALVSPSASAQTALASRSPGNRLTYLDEDDPFYVHRGFPKLTTPQWVGEPGVEAVVVLAIDDMREPERYETFLRPILRRLQQIDGRAPLSIMTCQVDPQHPRLQQWLKEGVSLEVHTIDHPC